MRTNWENFYVEGICCEGMLVELRLFKRQDLVGVISNLMKPRRRTWPPRMRSWFMRAVLLILVYGTGWELVCDLSTHPAWRI